MTAPEKQGSPHRWQFSKAHTGPRIAQGSGFQTVGREPQGGSEGLERGTQHTFLQIKIKTALNQLEK
jgi:hypothetical protein